MKPVTVLVCALLLAALAIAEAARKVAYNGPLASFGSGDLPPRAPADIHET